MRRAGGRGQCGTALIEFALVLPLLLAILLGMIEFARYILIHQKLDKVANSMADFVTQGTTISCEELTGFTAAAPYIMEPYEFNGQVIFSSVAFYNSPVPPCQQSACVAWQFGTSGTGMSHIGVQGGNAILPGQYQLAQGQNVIVAEAFINYTPLMSATAFFVPALGEHQLYKAAVFKPRQGSMTTLTPCS